MRLDTKMVRNLGFVGMLAVLPLAQSKVVSRQVVEISRAFP